MQLIVDVYEALKSFNRYCTRAEIENATGLDQKQVENGLDGLRRRNLLLVDGARRQRTLYRLRPSAPPVQDLRGTYVRSRKRGAARPTSHAQAPGRARHSIVPDLSLKSLIAGLVKR